MASFGVQLSVHCMKYFDIQENIRRSNTTVQNIFSTVLTLCGTYFRCLVVICRFVVLLIK